MGRNELIARHVPPHLADQVAIGMLDIPFFAFYHDDLLVRSRVGLLSREKLIEYLDQLVA